MMADFGDYVATSWRKSKRVIKAYLKVSVNHNNNRENIISNRNQCGKIDNINVFGEDKCKCSPK